MTTRTPNSTPATGLVDVDGRLADQVGQLVDFIMKNCLWQFHSRSWDRLRQNENILAITGQLLRGEAVDLTTGEQRCYWVDAGYLADSYRERYPWINELDADEITTLMQAVRERMDHLTVHGSLNEELTDKHY